MSCTLDELLRGFDAFEEQIPLETLVEGLERVRIDLATLEPVMRFGEQSYRRNLLHEGPGYQALLLCWREGQRSPIHDHRGSTCGVRVLRGTAYETRFDRTRSGYIYPVETVLLAEDSVCGSEDADIHQVSNLSSDEGLITLHIYSPALVNMGRYSLHAPTREELHEPVLQLTDGAGI